MKTSVIIKRDLNGVSVRQDSKTSFFNANDLLELYNATNPDRQKRLDKYLENKETHELMDAILEEMHNTTNSGDYENGVIRTKKGKNGGTWMHPYLMMDFGMWLSPQFKVTVLRWFYDNVVLFRNECGSEYKLVTDALFEKDPKTPPFLYSREANMLNTLVFGCARKNQRNKATEDQLALLKALQRADSKLIKDGLGHYERFEKLKELKASFALMQ